ncbi:MAG: alkaline phosphatase family protein [Actinomycetota bacterium]|nr:alkaline phosphatase family protein [Actinomycetota bacterium]
MTALSAAAAATAFLTAARLTASDPSDYDGPIPIEKLGGDAYVRRACDMPARWLRYIERGYHPGPAQGRDLIMVPTPPGYVGPPDNTAHSGPYPYLMQIPFVLYGPGFVDPRGPVELAREVTLADLAPTYADLMDFDFPRRQGRSLVKELKSTHRTPRLVVTVVIDGGGWNVLNRWPQAWPNLRNMIANGTSFEHATVGSSPSVTPTSHTNIGTGAFPNRHEVTAIVIRTDDGNFAGAFSEALRDADAEVAPSNVLTMPTLADLYDKATDNAAKVALLGFGNYVAGMIGHGAEITGADRDIAAFEESGSWTTTQEFFHLPAYLNDAGDLEALYDKVDLADGEADERWRGHEISPLEATPAFAPWVNQSIETIVANESFGEDDVTDLLYVNYKAPDAAGHLWNMIAPEQEDVLESTDRAVGDLVDYLDARVGPNHYLVAVVSDHGQTPFGSGGWPIDKAEMVADVGDALDRFDNDVSIVDGTTATNMFVDHGELRRNGLTSENLANFLSDYTIEDNAGDDYPGAFEKRRDERVFAGVFPGRKLSAIRTLCDRRFGTL